MIAILHASVIVLAIAHVATLGLLAVDLRRSRSMGSAAVVVLGGGSMAICAGVAHLYVPGWPAALAGAMCGALFIGYLAVCRHELRPAGVAAWSSFVLMTAAASVWGVHFVATMPVSTLTHALAWAALGLVAVSAPSAFVGWAAFHTVRTELLLGLACTSAALLMLAVNRGGGVATMLAIGLAVQGASYLAAPLVVGVAEYELRRQVA